MIIKLKKVLASVWPWTRSRMSKGPILVTIMVLALAIPLAACSPQLTRSSGKSSSSASSASTTALSTSASTGGKTVTPAANSSTSSATSTPVANSSSATATSTPVASSSTATATSTSTSPATTPTSATSTTSKGTKPSAAQVAAIKQVIEHANQEQIQALAANNPAIMQDTSTSGYYTQLAQTQSSMENSGVASIKLVKLTWGPIVLTSATTARATDVETWNTIFSGQAGTLQQSNTNIYALVLQNGVWKIESDQQPDASQSPSASSSPSANPNPVVPSEPTSPNALSQSANWAGYAASGKDFTSVSGSWGVPKVTPSATTAASATWVGIGGVSSEDLIQAGTEADVQGGQVTYVAWYELLPQAQQIIPMTVNAGDHLTVTIHQLASGQWQIVIKDTTSDQTFQRNVSYTSSNSSAEWIEEAPAIGQNALVPLDSFGSVTFTGASAVEGGKTQTIAQAGGQAITMENQIGEALVQTSGLSSSGSSFTVKRTSASATPTSPYGHRFHRFPDGFSG